MASDGQSLPKRSSVRYLETVESIDDAINGLEAEKRRLIIERRLAKFTLVKDGYVGKQDFKDFFLKYREYDENDINAMACAGLYRLIIVKLFKGEMHPGPFLESRDVVCDICGESTTLKSACNPKDGRYRPIHVIDSNYLKIEAGAFVRYEGELVVDDGHKRTARYLDNLRFITDHIKTNELHLPPSLRSANADGDK